MAEKSMLEYMVELENRLKSMDLDDLADLLSSIEVDPKDAEMYAHVEKLVCGHVYGFKDGGLQPYFDASDFAVAA